MKTNDKKSVLKQVAFLVGGRGSRLGELTQSTPKPMLQVAGRSFLSHLIDKAVHHNFNDILLLAGFCGDEILKVWGSHTANEKKLKAKGVRIRVFVEPKPAGTAGALISVKDYLEEEFLLVNGDSFFDFDWNELIRLHVSEDWLGKIALRHVDDGSRYGFVELDGERIIRFDKIGHAGPCLINGGVYLLRRSLVDHIDHTPISVENDIFPNLASDGLLYGRSFEDFFIDIGVPEDLARADAILASKLR